MGINVAFVIHRITACHTTHSGLQSIQVDIEYNKKKQTISVERSQRTFLYVHTKFTDTL